MLRDRGPAWRQVKGADVTATTTDETTGELARGAQHLAPVPQAVGGALVTGRQRGRLGRLIDRLFHARALRRWARIAQRAPVAELSQLRRDRAQAQALRQRLDEVIFVADSRLALPRVGSVSFPRPSGSDWGWRPQLWRGPLAQKGMVGATNRTMIGDEVTVFHDCQVSEVTLRQLRNSGPDDLAPFAVRMDVFRFDGGFLSLALDLPDAACSGLLRRHLVRLDAVVETEKRIEIFARLNIRHGPNTEQVVREFDLRSRAVTVEFDLAYTRMNERRIERMWVDLIFEGPEMNQITLRDLTLCRYPRAEL